MVAMKTVCHCRWHDSRNFPVGKEKAMQNPLKKVNLAHYWRKAFVKWGVAIIALLIVVYGVVGFFVVPGILRDKAQAFVYEKFERTLAMSDVSFNPFTLTACSGISAFSIFIIMKREAFHTLFAKFLLASTRSI